MSDNKKNKSFLKRWRFRYRFVILNSESFEEYLSFNISKLNLFVLLCVAIAFLMVSTVVVIAYSPLKEYIPGYTTTEIRRQVVALNLLSDSLNNELSNQEIYLENIKNIIEGRDVDTSIKTLVFSNIIQDSVAFDKTPEDSMLRVQVESEEKFNFFEYNDVNSQNIEKMLFFTPVNGLITQSYNFDEKHYGVDVVTKEKELIKSVLSGIVVFASWTFETGHVIVIQHENNLLSVYKHNSVLLKEQGESIEAGEAVAIIGNSGKWSTGPHLHFELWYNNNPVDPEQYILF
tara:strand:- start:597 stop:1463 length:867 start_codon:yes stop_codon:yes gene_type:complete